MGSDLSYKAVKLHPCVTWVCEQDLENGENIGRAVFEAISGPARTDYGLHPVTMQPITDLEAYERES